MDYHEEFQRLRKLMEDDEAERQIRQFQAWQRNYIAAHREEWEKAAAERAKLPIPKLDWSILIGEEKKPDENLRRTDRDTGGDAPCGD